MPVSLYIQPPQLLLCFPSYSVNIISTLKTHVMIIVRCINVWPWNNTYDLRYEQCSIEAQAFSENIFVPVSMVVSHSIIRVMWYTNSNFHQQGFMQTFKRGFWVYRKECPLLVAWQSVKCQFDDQRTILTLSTICRFSQNTHSWWIHTQIVYFYFRYVVHTKTLMWTRVACSDTSSIIA